MCGIAGIALKNKNSLNIKETVLALSRSIKHRGPDGEGFLLVDEKNAVACSSNDTPSFKTSQLNYLPQKNISEVNGEFNLALTHRRLSILDLSETGHQPMALQEGKLWIT